MLVEEVWSGVVCRAGAVYGLGAGHQFEALAADADLAGRLFDCRGLLHHGDSTATNRKIGAGKRGKEGIGWADNKLVRREAVLLL